MAWLLWKLTESISKSEKSLSWICRTHFAKIPFPGNVSSQRRSVFHIIIEDSVTLWCCKIVEIFDELPRFAAFPISNPRLRGNDFVTGVYESWSCYSLSLLLYLLFSYFRVHVVADELWIFQRHLASQLGVPTHRQGTRIRVLNFKWPVFPIGQWDCWYLLGTFTSSWKKDDVLLCRITDASSGVEWRFISYI